MKYDFISDNGWMSRKLQLTVFCMALITVGMVLSARYPGIEPVFATYCSSIIALNALYIGGNSAVKYIYTNSDKKKAEKVEE